MNTIKRRGLTITAAAVFVLGSSFMAVSAANATEITPSPTPTVSESPTPEPTATLSCTSFSEGINSATAAFNLTMDAALEQVTVTFEADSPEGGQMSVSKDVTSSGNYTLTVPNIPATANAHLIVYATYVFNQTPGSANAVGDCQTGDNVTISGPAVTPPAVTAPPAASGSTGGKTVVKKSVPKAATDGFELVQSQQQDQNNAIFLGVMGVLALGTVVTIVVVRRRQTGARS